MEHYSFILFKYIVKNNCPKGHTVYLLRHLSVFVLKEVENIRTVTVWCNERKLLVSDHQVALRFGASYLKHHVFFIFAPLSISILHDTF